MPGYVIRRPANGNRQSLPHGVAVTVCSCRAAFLRNRAVNLFCWLFLASLGESDALNASHDAQLSSKPSTPTRFRARLSYVCHPAPNKLTLLHWSCTNLAY